MEKGVGMRVIAGTARRLPLKTIEGRDTRPTTDRIKETLFNILQPDIAGCRFLDLFAGSGGIGIEALSRGAECAVFVENGRRQAACIRENLEFTHLSDRARVLTEDVSSAIARLSREEPFDFVFMDPPYGKGLEYRAFPALGGAGFVDGDTVVILEARVDSVYAQDKLRAAGFSIFREKCYKTNKHLFLRRI